MRTTSGVVVVYLIRRRRSIRGEQQRIQSVMRATRSKDRFWGELELTEFEALLPSTPLLYQSNLVILRDVFGTQLNPSLVEVYFPYYLLILFQCNILLNHSFRSGWSDAVPTRKKLLTLSVFGNVASISI